MIIAIPREIQENERRVAASPETVKKLVGLGAQVLIETEAGKAANFTDDAYKTAGAEIIKTAKELYAKAQVILKVQTPSKDEIKQFPDGSTLACIFNVHKNEKALSDCAAKKMTVFAMEMIPRISRAQSMDVLSSQSNLAGYKAVINAANAFGRAFPMLMTAAGTIAPAKVLIFGAGVAGLHAIATAKRMGAVVSAFDVRAAAKEQVESLGGTFIEVESDEAGEGQGGYAKEMSEDYKKRQAEKIEQTLAKSDIAITTALIPGKPAPRLITDAMIKLMKPGSIIVDMAVESGGNVEGSKHGEVVEKHGVQIIGPSNLASEIATDASALYAKNLFNFLTLSIKDGKLAFDWEDEIINTTAILKDGGQEFKKSA